MRTGFPTGCPTGLEEEMLIGFVPVVVDGGAGALLPIRPAPGCGSRNFCFGADRKPQGIIFIPQGSTKTVRVIHDPKATSHSYFAECIGLWNDVGDVDVVAPTLAIEAAVGGAAEFEFDVSAEVIGSAGDGLQLSNWSLTGVTRWNTCRPRKNAPYEGELDVTLTLEAGLRVVRLYLGSVLVASGSRSGNGVITLTAVNSSGVAGSVTVAYTTPVTSGCIVVKRWAPSYALVAGALSGTLNDPGRGERLMARLAPLAPGSYGVSATPMSDTGQAGTAYTDTIVVPGPPAAPGLISYVSGTIANTVIQFAASATVGATYRLYDVEDLNGPTKVSVVAATRGSGSGTLTLTLPALASGSGERWIILVAVNGGVEDATRQKFKLSYASGNIVVPLPNAPRLSVLGVQADYTVNLAYLYDATDEDAASLNLILNVEQYSPSSVFDAATVALGSGAVRSGVIAIAPASANTFFRFRATVEVTAGGTRGPWSAWTEWVYTSNVLPAAPGNALVRPVA